MSTGLATPSHTDEQAEARLLAERLKRLGSTAQFLVGLKKGGAKGAAEL